MIVEVASMFERYVAIDNVCAWPNLTRLADGTVIASIFNQPTHGGWEGDVEAWTSRDGGRTWQHRGTPAPHAPGTNRQNVAAGPTPDEALIVLASGWSDRPAPGTYRNPHEGHILPPWICRSEDGGYHLTRDTLELPEPDMAAVPFGDIVTLDDGTLGACLYTFKHGHRGSERAFFITSHDDGHTWGGWHLMTEGQINETTPIALGNGRLLAAARTLGAMQPVNLLVSEDDGRSWRYQETLTMPGQHPANLRRLNDGRVLLTYGVRNGGLWGVAARISDDHGESWGKPITLLNLAPDCYGHVDCGYPSTIQRDDGRLVTAYYSNWTAEHTGYHMGVLIWHL